MVAAVRARWKGGSRYEPPLYEPSIDDEWNRSTRRRIAKAMGRWLREAGKLGTTFEHLTDVEADGVASEMMLEYTKCRCERYIAEEELEKQPPDLDRLLSG